MFAHLAETFGDGCGGARTCGRTTTRSSPASTPTRACAGWGRTTTWCVPASSTSPASRSSTAGTWCTGGSSATCWTGLASWRCRTGRRLRGCVRPDDPAPRRPLPRRHHQCRCGRQLPGHRRAPRGALVRPGVDRRPRHRPRPRLGRERRLLVRGGRGGGGPDRHPDREGAGGAAADVVRDRAARPRGAAPVPGRGVVVPAGRRGWHRARARSVRGPRPLTARALGTRAGQPAGLPPGHLGAGPVHRPRRPGPGRRRHLVGGAARHPPARLVPGVPRPRPGDLPGSGGVGGRLAAHGTGAGAGAGPGPPGTRSNSRPYGTTSRPPSSRRTGSPRAAGRTAAGRWPNGPGG